MALYVCESNSYEETLNIGRKISNVLKSGNVIALIGDLGSGKTALTQGIVSGMGIDDYVTSPTFMLMNIYGEGNQKVCHFDLYRLSGAEDVADSGLDEYFGNGCICVIEWPEAAMPFLPADYVKVVFTNTGENKRKIEFFVDDSLEWGDAFC